MRSFTLILVPMLSLLNMGVQGASITNVLTGRRNGDMHGHPGDVHGHSSETHGHSSDIRGPVRHNAHHTPALAHRQIRNADFSKATEVPVTVSKRDIIPASEVADSDGALVYINQKRQGIYFTNIARPADELAPSLFTHVPPTFSGLPTSDSSTEVLSRGVIPSVSSDHNSVSPSSMDNNLANAPDSASQPALTPSGAAKEAAASSPSVVSRQDVVGVTDTIRDAFIPGAEDPTHAQRFPGIPGTTLQRGNIAMRQTNPAVIETELLNEFQHSG